MFGTLRWPYNNVQKELGPYGHVGVNTRQQRIGDLKFRFTGKLLQLAVELYPYALSVTAKSVIYGTKVKDVTVTATELPKLRPGYRVYRYDRCTRRHARMAIM